MNKTEKRLLDKAALAEFSALTARNSAMSVKERAERAWEAGHAFIMARYYRILEKYQGTEALRRILELDGYRGRGIDFTMNYYANGKEPLRAYAEATIGAGKTTGQLAIYRFDRILEKEDEA